MDEDEDDGMASRESPVYERGEEEPVWTVNSETCRCGWLDAATGLRRGTAAAASMIDGEGDDDVDARDRIAACWRRCATIVSIRLARASLPARRTCLLFSHSPIPVLPTLAPSLSAAVSSAMSRCPWCVIFCHTFVMRSRDMLRCSGSRECDRERTMFPTPPRPVVSNSPWWCGGGVSGGGLCMSVRLARPPRPVECLSKHRSRLSAHTSASAEDGTRHLHAVMLVLCTVHVALVDRAFAVCARGNVADAPATGRMAGTVATPAAEELAWAPRA